MPMSDVLNNLDRLIGLAKEAVQAASEMQHYDNAWRIELLIIGLQSTKEKLLVLIGENK